MTTTLVIIGAWTLGALVVARLAHICGWRPVATVLLVAGAVLLATGASWLLPGVSAAFRKVDLSAPPGPYGDTYYVLGQGHALLNLGLSFLILATITLWIARRGGRRTQWLLVLSASIFHLSVGVQLAAIFGTIPEALAKGISPADSDPVNFVVTFVPHASLLALAGVLVCSALTLRRMLIR